MILNQGIILLKVRLIKIRCLFGIDTFRNEYKSINQFNYFSIYIHINIILLLSKF